MKNDRATTMVDSLTILKESFYPYRGFTIIEQEYSNGRYSYKAIKNNVVYFAYFDRVPAVNRFKQIIDSNYERIAR